MTPEVALLALERALALPAAHGPIAFTGPPTAGKTAALVRRFAALVAADPQIAGAAIVTAARPEGARALAARIEAATGIAVRGATLDDLALELLRAHPLETGLALDLEVVTPLEAEEIFERAAAPLFSAEWSDFLGPEVDPEIAGLRTPDRFADAALRLIRKLRDAGIDPEAFLAKALRGAAAFYANPPNLASPALVSATKEEHRASLAVDDSELERQRRRELDLAKIVARLYRAYLDELVRHGCLTPSDALVEATRLLDERPAIARGVRTRLRVAIVDDAHDLGAAEQRFLRAIFGASLDGVTLAGDPSAATRAFEGARTDRLFKDAAVVVALGPGTLAPAIAAAMRAAIAPEHAAPFAGGTTVRVGRHPDRAAEAAAVAEHVAALVATGTPPGRIAVLHRTLRTLGPYEDALVARDLPVALAGDPAIFERRDVGDALALLWTAIDPFRHAWLLRALQLPAFGLSDASIAALCAEPPNPQPALLAIPDDPPGAERRWDRKRDVRLADNVLSGAQDAALSADARERVGDLRARRRRWAAWASGPDAGGAARAIVEDGGLLLPRPGETSAERRRRGALIDRLAAIVTRAAERRPFDGLAGALAFCERLAAGERGPEISDDRDDAVVVAAIDRVLSRRFAHVVVVDARAGAFPPYYVPDAFLFSPTYGMVPKDCVGDATAARTAKFTWYEHKSAPRAAYVKEQRRLFAAALGRADESVLITASGRATRGVAAPEIAAELAALLDDR